MATERKPKIKTESISVDLIVAYQRLADAVRSAIGAESAILPEHNNFWFSTWQNKILKKALADCGAASEAGQ